MSFHTFKVNFYVGCSIYVCDNYEEERERESKGIRTKIRAGSPDLSEPRFPLGKDRLLMAALQDCWEDSRCYYSGA